MKKSIEEGGKFTGVEIVKSFGNDLKSDFDRLLTFFGLYWWSFTTNTIT